MPYQEFSDGLYLLKQKNESKGVDHYGIADVGNRIKHSLVYNSQPIIIHHTPPSIKLDWLQNTGNWQVLGKITNESAAIMRIKEALKTPNYDLFGNNCEHFARYVASGKKESTQLQAAAFIAGLAALAYWG